jgi:hypothetical protein
VGYRDADTKARETAGLLSIKNLLIVETPLALQAGQQTYDLPTNNVVFEQATTAGSVFTGLPAVPTTAATTGASFDWSLTALAAARTGGLTTFTGDLLTRAGTFVTGTVYRGAWDPTGTKWWEGWTSYSRN